MRNAILIICCSCLFWVSCSDSAVKDQDPVAEQSEHVLNKSQDGMEMVKEGKENFSDRLARLEAILFAEAYKKIEMDPLDRLPNFNEANRSSFTRYRKSQPILNQRKTKVFPRVMFKAFRFADEKRCDQAVTDWLNGYESSADSIVLGQDVDAFKSPPLFCALLGNEFFILQTACIFQHESYDQLRNDFFAWFEKEGARFAWEVTCEAGKIKYKLKPA